MSDLISLVVALVTTALFVGALLLILRLNRQIKDRNRTYHYSKNLWDAENTVHRRGAHTVHRADAATRAPTRHF